MNAEVVDVAQVFPLIYRDLERAAHQYLRRREALFAPAGLVHEAYLRLAEPRRKIRVNSREHFCALAKRAMRQILIDRSRRHGALKRGGDQERVELCGTIDGGFDHLDLDRALLELAALDRRQALIVELRYFQGMTAEEIAAHLSVSVSTVEKSWRGARAWLALRLSE